MSAKYTTLLTIPGLDARIEVEADYNWSELGTLVAEGYDYEQAEFLDAIAQALYRMGGNGLMQLQYLADRILEGLGKYDAGAISWFLNELLIRLED